MQQGRAILIRHFTLTRLIPREDQIRSTQAMWRPPPPPSVGDHHVFKDDDMYCTEEPYARLRWYMHVFFSFSSFHLLVTRTRDQKSGEQGT